MTGYCKWESTNSRAHLYLFTIYVPLQSPSKIQFNLWFQAMTIIITLITSYIEHILQIFYNIPIFSPILKVYTYIYLSISMYILYIHIYVCVSVYVY